MEVGAPARAQERDAAAEVPRHGLRSVLADYFTMTKPRVQSLLLLTTVTTMYVAGDPSPGLVLLTCLGGALSAGGPRRSTTTSTATSTRSCAGRPRALCPRAAWPRGPRSRTASPWASPRSRCSSCGSTFWRRCSRSSACSGMWACTPSGSSADASEHRHRRRRGGGAAAGRVGHGHRLPRLERAVPVRDRLLLDASALLGAVAADEGRVRARGVRCSPSCAGRPRRGRGSSSTPACSWPSPSCRSLAGSSARSTPWPPASWGGRAGALGALAPARGPAIGPAAVPLLARLPRPALRGDGARRSALESRADAVRSHRVPTRVEFRGQLLADTAQP